MRAVITVIGKDMVGILAKVSAVCAKENVNVTEVTQSILQDLFAMIMLVDLEKATVPFNELVDQMTALDGTGSISGFVRPCHARGYFQLHAQNLKRERNGLLL